MTLEKPTRRTLLGGLAALPPLAGVPLLTGGPALGAERITDDLLWSYKQWLHFEHRMLCFEIGGHDVAAAHVLEGQLPFRPREEWHFQWTGGRGPAGWIDAPQPSTRAALVLAAVGCDWR